MEVREKPFSYRQVEPQRTRMSPKAAELDITIGSATLSLAAIARVAVTHGT